MSILLGFVGEDGTYRTKKLIVWLGFFNGLLVDERWEITNCTVILVLQGDNTQVQGSDVAIEIIVKALMWSYGINNCTVQQYIYNNNLLKPSECTTTFSQFLI